MTKKRSPFGQVLRKARLANGDHAAQGCGNGRHQISPTSRSQHESHALGSECRRVDWTAL